MIIGLEKMPSSMGPSTRREGVQIGFHLLFDVNMPLFSFPFSLFSCYPSLGIELQILADHLSYRCLIPYHLSPRFFMLLASP